MDLRRDTVASEAAVSALEWINDDEVSMFVNRLPELQRQTLALRYFFDLSTEEIAVILNRSPGAIRKLQSRALRLLEDRLATVGRSSVNVRRTPTLVRLRHPRVLVERRFALLGSGPTPTMR